MCLCVCACERERARERERERESKLKRKSFFQPKVAENNRCMFNQSQNRFPIFTLNKRFNKKSSYRSGKTSSGLNSNILYLVG